MMKLFAVALLTILFPACHAPLPQSPAGGELTAHDQQDVRNALAATIAAGAQKRGDRVLENRITLSQLDADQTVQASYRVKFIQDGQPPEQADRTAFAAVATLKKNAKAQWEVVAVRQGKAEITFMKGTTLTAP